MRAIIDYIAKNKEWIFSGIGVLIISALVLFFRNLLNKPRSLKKPDEIGGTDTNVLRGTVNIPLESGKSHDVFYPRRFQNPPFLTVKAVGGQIGFDVVEQRNDGFKISTYGGGYATAAGLRIEWVAEGELSTSRDGHPSSALPELPASPAANTHVNPPEAGAFRPDDKDIEILRYLYRDDVDRLVSYIAEGVHLDRTETKFRLNRLAEHGFVRPPGRVRPGRVPQYRLTDKGVAFLLKIDNRI